MDLMINTLIGIEQQLRILHWQTSSYAQHKAFGDTYAALGDSIDAFMESFMGRYGKIVLKSSSIQVINMQQLDLPDFVQGSIEFLTSLSSELNPETDTELLNIRDEMLASMTKLKYLLTLK